jgi:hypothetical protein
MLHCRRPLLIVVTLILVGFLMKSVSPAQAENYFVNYTFTNPGICNDNYWAVLGKVSWNMPPGPNTLHVVQVINGVVNLDMTKTAGFSASGSLSGTFFSELPSFNTAPPYVSVLTYDYSKDGSVFGHTVITVTCVGGVSTVTVVNGLTAAGGGTACIFPDGRINCRGEEAAQTAAIYCTSKGDITVYLVYQEKGLFAFETTVDEIKEVPDHPATNTLIKQALGVRLSRLTTGHLQVNAPGLNPLQGDYVFTFNDCSKP